MGCSISVVLAEITLQSLKTQIFSQKQDEICIWKRYVDDVLAMIPKDNVNTFLDYINSFNVNIQFTTEIEENNSIPFLDLQISKDLSGLLSFSIYKKPSHTDKYLDFESNHPLQQKFSVMQTLLHRADRLCSNENKLEEIRNVKAALRKNGYPKSIVNKSFSNSNRINPQENNFKYISAPYIKGTSERINRILKIFDIRLGHKPTNTLRSKLCNLKDKRRSQDAYDAIYKINCTDCDQVYIGETSKNLHARVKEHESKVRNHRAESQIFQHVRDTDHTIDWNAKVISKCSNTRSRTFLEACYTVSNTKSYNRSIDIPEVYLPTISEVLTN